MNSWQIKVPVSGIAILSVGIFAYWLGSGTLVIIWLLGTLVFISLAMLSILWGLKKQSREIPPFWAVFQASVISKLHHPHASAQELDEYLEELEALTITDKRRAELTVLLEKKRDDTNESPDERERAEILLFAMPRVVQEEADAAHVASIIGSRQ